jgi:hypothetical protein
MKWRDRFPQLWQARKRNNIRLRLGSMSTSDRDSGTSRFMPGGTLSRPRWNFWLWIVAVAGCFAAGMYIGRIGPREVEVHAQDRNNLPYGCRVVVPKSWGEYKGASAYGLAFQDETGTLRFMLHPPCGNIDSATDASTIDLVLQRK